LRLFPQSRIVNGQETGVNEYPMMAALVDLRIRDLFCGASVISSRYCLTAAHCVDNRPTADTAVLIGDHDISSGTLMHHPGCHKQISDPCKQLIVAHLLMKFPVFCGTPMFSTIITRARHWSLS
jgi:hypothetical protein